MSMCAETIRLALHKILFFSFLSFFLGGSPLKEKTPQDILIEKEKEASLDEN